MKTLPLVITLLFSSIVNPIQANVGQSQVEPAKIEVCFVLDTTGSMGGLIEGAKQKIWSIANELISAKPTPELRLGLVGYRDKGDVYVTKNHPLTNDIDVVYAKLLEFQADGGGDTPESVNEALAEAISEMAWAESDEVLKIIFLVGDAPAQMGYKGPKYPELCKQAAKRGIVINTIQCGESTDTTAMWKEIASLSEGEYAAIAQTGNMAVIATPMDVRLAELNRAMGGTLVAYGSDKVRSEVEAKQSIAESVSAPAAAERLKYNVTTGKAVQGDGELLDALMAGSESMETINKTKLPSDLAALSDEGFQAEITRRQETRKNLKNEIAEVSKKRDEYLLQERAKTGSDKDSFDERVSEMIRQQAERKGITY